MSDSLTEKQRKFVRAYTGECYGNGTEAAKKAGYSGSRSTLAAIASENLTKPKIRKAIKQIREQEPEIMDPAEIQRFWSTKIREEGNMKASRLLAKSQAMLTDRVEVSGPDGDPISFDVEGMDSDDVDEKLDEFLGDDDE